MRKKNLLRNKWQGCRTNVPLKWKGIYIYKTRGWDGREKFKKRMKKNLMENILMKSNTRYYVC